MTSTGRLLSWGMGYGEQLGHGRKDEEPVPREVAGAGVVVGITCGLEHTPW